MQIEVTFSLNNEIERAVFERMVRDIQNIRAGHSYYEPKSGKVISYYDDAKPTIQDLADADQAKQYIEETQQPVSGRFHDTPVADVLRAYLADHGIAEARKLLSQFGVDRINELPEDQHDAFRVAAEK